MNECKWCGSALILLLWLLSSSSSHASAPVAVPEDRSQRALAALIAERSAELAITRKTVVMPTDEGLETANAIKQGDYAAAARIAGAVIARSHEQGWSFHPFTEYVGSIVRGDDPALLEQLNRWLGREPDSAVALLIRGMYYAQAGRTARGAETSNMVPDRLMKAFQTDMTLSAADLSNSVRLDGKIPWSYVELERVSLHAGNARLGETTFEQGARAFPDYYPLYKQRLHWLTPKWGGSVEAMYRFVDQYAGGTGVDSPLRTLYLDLYAELIDAASFQCAHEQNDRGSCFEAVLGRFVRPGLHAHVQQALELYKTADAAEFSGAVWPLLDAIACPDCGGSAATFGGDILQRAANIMGSDNRMMDHPSQNSYMLDDITAHVWARLGNTGNADKKYHEALADAEHTVFSEPAIQAQVLATIYDHMAAFSDNAGQFVDVIVYYDAANAVAGDNHNATPWRKCYAFYRLKHYAEAVKECSSLIEGHGNFLLTHYWRGKAYEQLGEWDKSIADFAPVADSSDNWFRVGAAVDMSYDFGQKKDYAGQLASMNGHAYLFDASMQPPNDLAVAYNNRCFAYMRLGQLRKALADCQTSLRYGRLPDAFHKQQELLKALGEAPADAETSSLTASDLPLRLLNGSSEKFVAYVVGSAAFCVIAMLMLWNRCLPVPEASEESIRPELSSGERLLWSGIPYQGLRFRAADAALIPFSLIWGGFAIFWEYNVLTQSARAGGTHAPPQFLALWGIPFVMIGLYLIAGRFFVDAWMRSRMTLAVTDRRIMIRTRLRQPQVRSLELRTLGEVFMKQGVDGRGTITFGPGPSNGMMAPGWPSANRRMPPAFEGIEQVREVNDLIQRAVEAAHKRA